MEDPEFVYACQASVLYPKARLVRHGEPTEAFTAAARSIFAACDVSSDGVAMCCRC